MDMDVIGSLFDSSNKSSNQLNTSSSIKSESISPDDITAMLVHSFNEAEEDNASDDEGIDWGISETEDEGQEDNSQDDDESTSNEDNNDVSEEDNDESENYNDEDEENVDNEDTNDEEQSQDDEILGSYEAIKDELDAERETLSDVYERFFKDIVDPLFRKLEDSNINVAFDTTRLKSEGIIRIELSHRNSDANAEMEINIFANTVNGEFLGMENSDGEAVSTSLDDVSLDDLLNILIKVLA